MPAIVVCAACATKLKVPVNSAAKALRCPKCKGVVPLTPEQKLTSEPVKAAAAKSEPKPAPSKPKAPPAPPKDDEELEVNEAADEDEFEVNEAAEDEDEFEVNEAADDEDEEEEEEDAPLAKLGFAKVKDPYKKGKVPDEARKAIEKTFVKNEKTLWTGRPNKAMIESSAWIGLVVGPICMFIGLAIFAGMLFIPAEGLAKLGIAAFGGLFLLMFGLVGILAIVFRKSIGGNVHDCYIVTNKRAYICCAKSGALKAFTPQQLADISAVESTKFDEAGDIIFAYEMQHADGVMLDKYEAQKHQGKAVGFLCVDKMKLVRAMMEELLIEPGLKNAKRRRKKEKKRR